MAHTKWFKCRKTGKLAESFKFEDGVVSFFLDGVAKSMPEREFIINFDLTL